MPNPFLAIARKNAGAKRNFAQGAQFSRLTADWIRSSASIDLEVRSDIRVLRSRARTLVRDNEHARQFVRLMKTNLIGAYGIRPIPSNMGADGQPAKKANAAIVKAWAEWGHAEYASTDTLSAFPEIEKQVAANLVTDGEFIVRIWEGFDNPFGFALEVIDPDLLDEQFNQAPDQNGVQIRMGIEMDRFRRPIAYHLWKYHPAEQGFRNERIRVPASEIIHRFIPLRSGQTRGISWFAPVLQNAKMLAGYNEAVLVAARTAAATMGFFTRQTGEDEEAPPATGEKMVMEQEPGVALELPAGLDFKPWDPKQPSTVFETFVSAMVRMQAVGLGVSYMSLSGDLNKTSYSSGRIGLLGERDEYEALQVWLSQHFHRRVYRAWLPIALITPFLSLPSYDAARWLETSWQGRRWQWVDPAKDIQAIENEIRLGINSRQRVCHALGRDWSEIAEQLAHENEVAKDLNIDISGATVTVKEAEPGNDSEDGEDPASDSTDTSADTSTPTPKRALVARVA